MKVSADNKIKVAHTAEFVPNRIENNVGKCENAVTSIFAISHNVFFKTLAFSVNGFLKASFSRPSKVWITQ